MKLSVGQSAPLFTLPDQSGRNRALKDFLGSWVFLYFYPKDDTPGCTTEACSIRDNYTEFTKKKVVVLGISFDTSKSHEKFITKYKLPFVLLADVDKKVIQDYDCWAQKEFMGREYMGTLRTSFLINPEGKIAKIYETVRPKDHIEDVLADITRAMKKASK